MDERQEEEEKAEEGDLINRTQAADWEPDDMKML